MTRRHGGRQVAWLLAAAVAAPLGAVPAAETDLDAFMAKVLERRNESWRQLHDYILSERERFDLIGPGDQRLFGGRREYTWFIRDGYLVRSPLRFDGVDLDDKQRRDYEDKWLRDEQAREQKASERKAQEKTTGSGKTTEGRASVETGAPDPAQAPPADVAGLPDDAAAIARRGMEPRFVSEAYFMRFKFEPGNYYLAGRETLDGRPVLRIEYYPTRLFEPDRSLATATAAGMPRRKPTSSASSTRSRSSRCGSTPRSIRSSNTRSTTSDSIFCPASGSSASTM